MRAAVISNMRPCLLAWRTLLAAFLLVAATDTAVAQTGRISGTVKDETGQPIKGATITADNPDASPKSFTATTDDKGRFGMIGLRSGPWNFTARAPGFAPQGTEMGVRSSPANNAPLTFALAKIPIPPSILGTLSAKDLQGELAEADGLYNAQKWDEAIGFYRSIIAKAPSLSVINLQIAAAYLNKKDFDGAIAAYNDLLQTDPSNDKARIGIAMANLEKGDLSTAEQTLEAASHSPATTREVFYNLGELKLARSRADEAVKAYERASQLDPTWGKPIYALGRIAFDQGDKSRALKYFEQVVAVDPLSPEAAQAKPLIEQLKNPKG
jgi:Flp pilus assembly protein TadD